MSLIRKLSAILCLAASSQLNAQSAREAPLVEEWHSGLTGYRGVSLNVFVSGIGVDTFRLRQRVELKLRQNGIAILPDTTPILLVSCSTVSNKEIDIAAYSCGLHVRDILLRSTPSAFRINSEVYQSFPAVGTTTRGRLDQNVRDFIDRVMDEFLIDWYKANPKK